MKQLMTSAAVIAVTAVSANAGGLDRSGQDVGIIFQDGTYAELSFGYVDPTLSGTDNATMADYGDVAAAYLQGGIGFKTDLTEQLSLAVYTDNPYGGDVEYPASATTPLLATTKAKVQTTAINAFLRYKFNENFSAHGGVRIEQASGEITLGGAAYGPANGYNVKLETDTGIGYSAGVAYERKDIALRVALTYHASIEHDFDSMETFPAAAIPTGAPIPAGVPVPSSTPVDTPAAYNLDFQSGVAENTLVFGSIRYAEWGSFEVTPGLFGTNLASLSDSTTYNIGVARRFTDNFAGSISVSYEEEGDPLASPLAPSTGSLGITIGGRYTMDNVTFSGGINYTTVGDATPQTGGVARADFADNSAFGLGFKVGYNF